MTILDEVHAVAIYGKTGSGRANEVGAHNEVDIIQGTLGKGVGVFCGYISSDEKIIDAIRLTASPFIFTTSLPPVLANASLENIMFLENNPSFITDFHQVVKKTKNILKEHNIDIADNASHIIQLVIGDPQKTKDIYQILLGDYNIYLQNIGYPTVKKGRDMFRITPNRLHSEEMIYHLAKSLKKVL